MAKPLSASLGSSPAASNRALAKWLERAENTNMPVFSATVSEVTSIVDSSSTSAQDLATVIGHDAALTAKLLKLANSPLFRQQGRSARTISSAVVLLGFDAVRDLAITLSIIDRATRGPEFAPLIDTLMRAFHCAGQARSIGVRKNTNEPEELFLAGLLSRLGELIFWASETPEVDALAEHWCDEPPTPETQREILGFTLDQLTQALVQQWHLGSLLQAVVSARKPDERVRCVTLGHRIAATANSKRWQGLTLDHLAEHEALASVVREHQDLLNQSAQDSLEQIRTQATEVEQIAKRFGVVIKQPRPLTAPGRASIDADGATAAVDPARQLAVLAEMTTAMQGPATLDQLLRLALAGIADGGGFDRVFFALLTRDREGLRIKHHKGSFDDLPTTLTLASNPPLSDALANSGPVLLDQPWSLRGATLWRCADYSVLQPVFAGTTAIGLFYADRAQRGPKISAESVAALGLFVQHLSLGLKTPG